MTSSAIHSLLADFFAAQTRVLEWGTVSLGAPLPNADKLRAWVSGGLHADLRYMEENLDKRADPCVLFPWAKTAVLFSVRQPVAFGTDTGDFRVASYALGEDYHRVTRRILKEVEAALRAQHAAPLQFSGFSDTWPVFERDLAAEAGIGWRGKNTTILHRQHGSGFLLAGFVLDVDLETRSVPLADFCGGCTACLDACPTDALIEPGRLDANKCISYWTIEHKGAIPEALSEKFGNLIFGCDICQDVCPWNRKAKKRAAETPLPDRWPRAAEEWLAVLRKGGGFQSRFKDTPLPRAGRKALLRNLLIAMRNSGNALSLEWREVLEREEEDAAVRAELERSR